MVSAIALAYFKHATRGVLKKPDPRLYVPLINVPRQELRLRPECIRAFELAFPSKGKLDAAELLRNVPFLDDVQIESLRDRNQLLLIITDHNRLGFNQQAFDSLVVGVFDHHADEKVHTDAYDREVETCGSCCSLIARKWMTDPDAVISYMPPQLAQLLLEPILIDTANLKGSVTTGTDLAAAQFLYNRMELDKSREERRDFFKSMYKELKQAKKQLRNLSSDELLRRDCKILVEDGVKVAFSTISWSLDDDNGWLSRESHEGSAPSSSFGTELAESTDPTVQAARSIAESIIEFAKSHSIDIVIVMLRKGKGDLYERQIIVAAKKGEGKHAAEALEIGLEKLQDHGSTRWIPPDLHLFSPTDSDPETPESAGTHLSNSVGKRRRLDGTPSVLSFVQRVNKRVGSLPPLAPLALPPTDVPDSPISVDRDDMSAKDPTEQLFRGFEDHPDLELLPLAVPGLGPESSFSDPDGTKWTIRTYRQMNAGASRKVVMPAIAGVLNQVGSFATSLKRTGSMTEEKL